MAIKPIPTTTLATTFTTGSYMLRGAITSGSVATISNINRYKQNKISKNKAIRNSVKSAIQGGIASTTAVATLQQYGEKKRTRYANSYSCRCSWCVCCREAKR
jgi:hypothetical protein